MYLGVHLDRIYVGFCLKLDRFDMIREEVSSIATSLESTWLKWIWNECSPTALQWVMLNLPMTKYLLP